MCVSGTCDALNVSGRVQANGCVPLPLVPCDPSDKSQLWMSLPGAKIDLCCPLSVPCVCPEPVLSNCPHSVKFQQLLTIL